MNLAIFHHTWDINIYDAGNCMLLTRTLFKLWIWDESKKHQSCKETALYWLDMGMRRNEKNNKEERSGNMS